MSRQRPGFIQPDTDEPFLNILSVAIFIVYAMR
jgi:hypothetical protein